MQDQDTIIREIQRIAREKGIENPLKLSEFSAETGISSWKIYNTFEGWREACELAGVRPYYQNITIDEDDLFKNMQKVFISYKGVCSRNKFNRLSKYSVHTYRRRFGKWNDVLLNFRRWVEIKGIEFPFINDLPLEKSKEIKENITVEKSHSEAQQWQSTGGSVYGPFLNFKGLQHAPINEQGVVFLFGMVCTELGFIVEAIRTQYPDCEAKRLVDKSQNKWERVMIEFEFKSSNFRHHGHRPELCDLIICWEHNWPECPLEVIELKSAIKKIQE